MRLVRMAALFGSVLFSIFASATIFGSIRGIVHDPHHRPVSGAQVTLRAVNSEWTKTAVSSDSGEFVFSTVPVGVYSVTVSKAGFDESAQTVTVLSGSEPVIHVALNVATVKETVNVSAAPPAVATDSATPTTLVGRKQIQQAPGADRTNSLAMITDFVPGTYVTHDQLHIRGGHQVSWLIDGVPVPNTNIASNVGPQFAPQDIDYFEVQRGSYDADYGDRTYGVFNVVPRTGFERDKECDLVASFGNYY